MRLLLIRARRTERLMRKLDGLKVEAILLTHAHFDHIGGVDALRKQYGCPVYIHAAEKDWLTDAAKNGSPAGRT